MATKQSWYEKAVEEDFRLPPLPGQKKGVLAPKLLGDAVDLLYNLRERRYSLQREAKVVEEAEGFLKNLMVNHVGNQNLSGAAGAVARIELKEKEVVQATDWEALNAYILKTKALDMFQHRLNDAAVRERWAAGKTVPGVTAVKLIQISIKKV